MSTQMQLRLTGRMVLVLAVMAMCVPGATMAADNNDPNKLSGGYSITISLPDNLLLPTTIHILGNFTLDGNFIFSDSAGTFGPSVPVTLPLPPPTGGFLTLPTPFTQSPGHGQWVRTAKGQFTLDSQHIVFDNAGQFYGFSRGRATIMFDPKTGAITGTNFLQLTTKDGFSLPGLPGTLTGERLPIEPPPAP